jgi:ActR/RegA family two-component response regulator
MMLPVPRSPSVPVSSFFSPERPGCVVVIDQDRVWADGLCGALGQDLFEVHAGYGWPDLARLVDAQSPTVLVVDLGTDAEAGLAAIRRLRLVHPSDALRVVATVGQGRLAEITAARLAGCDTCLARPASFEALREIVRQVA